MLVLLGVLPIFRLNFQTKQNSSSLLSLLHRLGWRSRKKKLYAQCIMLLVNNLIIVSATRLNRRFLAVLGERFFSGRSIWESQTHGNHMQKRLILICLLGSSRERLISCAHAVSEAAKTTWLRNNNFDFDFSLWGQRATRSKHWRKWSLRLPQRISRPLAPRKGTFLRLTTDLGRRYTNRRGMIRCQRISLLTTLAPTSVFETGL